VNIKNILKLQEEISVLKSKKETIAFNGYINFMEINGKLNNVNRVILKNGFQKFKFN